MLKLDECSIKLVKLKKKWGNVLLGHKSLAEMQAVILAGGLGTRLKPFTETMPKSMLSILGKPFVQYQLELLLKNGIRDVVLCVGYKSEYIKSYLGNGEKFGVNISYSDDGKNLLGTAGALKNAEGLLKNYFFLMNGDSYLPIDFETVLKVFEKRNKLGLMVVYKNVNRYTPSNVVLKDWLVTKYDRERKHPRMVYVDYGLSVLNKEALEYIAPGKFCMLDEVYQKLAAQKQLSAFVVRRRFYEVGSLSGFRDFERYLRLRSERPTLSQAAVPEG